MYDAISITLIGSAFLLAFLGRSSEDEYIKGLFSHSALAMLIGAVNAVRIMAVDGNASNNLIITIWAILFSFMLILLFSLTYLLYNLIKDTILKYNKIKSGELENVK